MSLLNVCLLHFLAWRDRRRRWWFQRAGAAIAFNDLLFTRRLHHSLSTVLPLIEDVTTLLNARVTKELFLFLSPSLFVVETSLLFWPSVVATQATASSASWLTRETTSWSMWEIAFFSLKSVAAQQVAAASRWPTFLVSGHFRPPSSFFLRGSMTF